MHSTTVRSERSRRRVELPACAAARHRPSDMTIFQTEMRDRIDEEVTFRKLEVRLAYMETKNLAKTAEALDVSTVSVHRALHSLEQGVRCALFQHEGRK